MASFWEWYDEYMYNRADPRTRDRFLLATPGPILIIVGMYLYFCCSAGPRYMKDKEPYSLRKTLIVYNLLQIFASTYLVCESLKVGWWGGINVICSPVVHTPESIRLASACYAYYILKIVDLLDTVFFVLRKKERQITFLHIYHHTLMPLSSWFGVRYFPGGHVTLFGVINSFVHITMYTYYMLSALGPEVQKYLWWKKYLTTLQLVQFAIVFIQNSLTLMVGCDFPKAITGAMLFNASAFIYMFGSFYVKNYTKNRQKLPNGTGTPIANGKND